MSDYSSIDWRRIEEWEGIANNVYVPKDAGGHVIGTSGPTIGTGVDLGTWSEEGLRELGIDGALLEKLRPYLGRKGEAAAQYVSDHPLTISDAERSQLDRAVQDHFVKKLRSKYDDAVWQNEYTLRSPRFTDLPGQMQTVLYSVAHQYGLALNQRCPRFWKSAVEQRWTEVAQELKNFGDQTPSRREKEAALIAQVISDSTQPVTTSMGTYVGQVVNGVPCGRGTLSYPDGRTYAGPFAQGLPWGDGTITYPNGERFEGFVLGTETGPGTYFRANGDVFVGGDPHTHWGDATIFFSDGRVYEGQTARGYTSGYGRMTYPDGRVEEGRWAAAGVRYPAVVPKEDFDTYTGPVIVTHLFEHGASGYVKHATDGAPVYADVTWTGERSYKGGWSSANTADGRGKYHDAQKGLTYVGQFSDGRFNGEGHMRVPEGTYTGNFKDGMPHGDGTFVSTNGTTLGGQWIEGSLNGRGIQKSPSGLYEGEFHKGLFHGSGTWRSSDGRQEYSGEFKYGAFERGQGTWTNRDRTVRYSGEWERGQPNGVGEHVYPGGTYNGHFIDGQAAGHGTAITASGFRVEGTWVTGQLTSGRVTWPDGSWFEGTVKDGRLDSGKYFDRNGKELRDPKDVGRDERFGLRERDQSDGEMEHPMPGEVCGWTRDREFICVGPD